MTVHVLAEAVDELAQAARRAQAALLAVVYVAAGGRPDGTAVWPADPEARKVLRAALQDARSLDFALKTFDAAVAGASRSDAPDIPGTRDPGSFREAPAAAAYAALCRSCGGSKATPETILAVSGPCVSCGKHEALYRCPARPLPGLAVPVLCPACPHPVVIHMPRGCCGDGGACPCKRQDPRYCRTHQTWHDLEPMGRSSADETCALPGADGRFADIEIPAVDLAREAERA